MAPKLKPTNPPPPPPDDDDDDAPPPPPPEDDDEDDTNVYPSGDYGPPPEEFIIPLEPTGTSVETQRSDPTQVRKSLKFPLASDLRLRVATTMATGAYFAPSRDFEQANMDAAATQTDNAYHVDAATGEGDTEQPAPNRVEDLNIDLPKPSEFPVLTAAQLQECEHRIRALLQRLEIEILRASDQEAKEAELALSSMSTRTRGMKSTKEWFSSFSQSIDHRIRMRYRDPAAKLPPVQWAEAKLETNSSPLRGSRHSNAVMNTKGGYGAARFHERTGASVAGSTASPTRSASRASHPSPAATSVPVTPGTATPQAGTKTPLHDQLESTLTSVAGSDTSDWRHLVAPSTSDSVAAGIVRNSTGRGVEYLNITEVADRVAEEKKRVKDKKLSRGMQIATAKSPWLKDVPDEMTKKSKASTPPPPPNA